MTVMKTRVDMWLNTHAIHSNKRLHLLLAEMLFDVGLHH